MAYSYIKGKMIWYKNNLTPITIENIKLIDTRETDKPINDIATITLPHSDSLYENFQFLMTEGDLVIVYGKEVTETSEAVFDTDDIVWTGQFLDRVRTDTPDTSELQLKIKTLGYDVFNKFHDIDYSDSNSTSVPFIIADIIRSTTENIFGRGTYELDIKYVGYPRKDGIQVTTPNGGDQSAIEFTDDDIANNTAAYQAYTALSSDYKFVDEDVSFVRKPVHEWITELSTPQWTNSADNKDIEYDYVFRISGTEVYWYYPSATTTITIDKDSFINSIKESSGNEQSTNYLIVEAGEDFDGDPIFWYVEDLETPSSVRKDRYTINDNIAGKNNTYDNTNHPLRKQYSAVTNTAFREKVIEIIKSKADYYFKTAGRAKNTLPLEIPFTRINVGDLVTVDIPYYDYKTYRVKTTTNRIGITQFSTSLELEEVVL